MCHCFHRAKFFSQNEEETESEDTTNGLQQTLQQCDNGNVTTEHYIGIWKEVKIETMLQYISQFEDHHTDISSDAHKNIEEDAERIVVIQSPINKYWQS